MVDTKSQVYAVRIMDAVSNAEQRQTIVQRVTVRLSPRVQLSPSVLDKALALGQQNLLETASLETARHALGVFREEGLMAALVAQDAVASEPHNGSSDSEESYDQRPRGWVSLRWKILAVALVPVLLLGGLWLFDIFSDESRTVQRLILDGAVQSTDFLSDQISHVTEHNAGKLDLAETQGILKDVVSAAVLPVDFAIVTDKTGRAIAAYDIDFNEGTAPVNPLQAWRELTQDEATLVEKMASTTARYQDPPSGQPVYSLNTTDPIARDVVTQTGEHLLFVGHPIEATGGALILSLHTDSINHEVLNSVRSTAIYLAIALVLALIFSLLFARNLTNRLLGLAYSADEISLGNLGAAIDTHSRDEIGDVGQAIDRMRVSLETAMNRLNRK